MEIKLNRSLLNNHLVKKRHEIEIKEKGTLPFITRATSYTKMMKSIDFDHSLLSEMLNHGAIPNVKNFRKLTRFLGTKIDDYLIDEEE